MNDYHAIADKLRDVGMPEYADRIEHLNSELIQFIMVAFEVMEAKGEVPAEKRLEITDFAFNQRSYR